MWRTKPARRTKLLGLLAWLSWSAIEAWSGEQATSASPLPERPNFILCMTDDQGWGDVSYNGLKDVQTPTLDAMAAAGVRFNRFYAAAPLCSPTRASALTGRHPNRMGCFLPGSPMRLEEITIAQAIKPAGYVTGHFGKWHLNGVRGPGKMISADDPLNPGRLGFDEWLSVSNYFDLNWTLSRRGKEETFTGDGSEYIVGEALKFIAAAAQERKPFLAVIWFGNPHSPHRALPEDIEAAGGSAYYGELRAIDRGMGQLREGLRKLGVADNTLVWFCSDNGAASPGSTGGLRGKKGSVWEGGIRVPGIVEWPARVKKPFVTDVPAFTSDIYPTILDILGLHVPNQVKPLDGISILPLLEGKMTERPRPMGFWHYSRRPDVESFTVQAGHAAWMDNRHKLHRLLDGSYELYDLVADPAEEKNLLDSQPQVTTRMKADLAAWMESVVKSFRGEDYPRKALGER